MVTLVNMPTTSFHMLRPKGADCGNCVMIPIPLAWYPVPPKRIRCEAIADLATTRTDQNEHDYTPLGAAADDGRVAGQSGECDADRTPWPRRRRMVCVHGAAAPLGLRDGRSHPQPAVGCGRTVDLAMSS